MRASKSIIDQMRIVTPEQYRKGYTVVSINQIPNTRHKKFKLVKKMSDGNYLVKVNES